MYQRRSLAITSWVAGKFGKRELQELKMSKVKGSCYCGTVSWEFSLPINTVIKCHCGSCRKLQGSDYSTWVVVRSENYSISNGKNSVTSYQATSKSSKHFCSVCGSAVFLVNGRHFPDDVVLALGAIDNYSDELAPKMQVYSSDRASWVNLHEDEPVFS